MPRWNHILILYWTAYLIQTARVGPASVVWDGADTPASGQSAECGGCGQKGNPSRKVFNSDAPECGGCGHPKVGATDTKCKEHACFL
jgi:hypothetical protein